MNKFLSPFSDRLYAVMRIVAGLLFSFHGAQKLFGLFGGAGGSGEGVELMSRMGLAGIIEFFGGVLVMLGLFTGWAAFIASGQMAAAFFLAHFPRGFLPIANGGELAVLYCFVFLYIAARGSGPMSIDAARGK